MGEVVAVAMALKRNYVTLFIPQDKLTIVKCFKEMGEVLAVTGDGTAKKTKWLSLIPQDKSTVVKSLKELEKVVAVNGDGTKKKLRDYFWYLRTSWLLSNVSRKCGGFWPWLTMALRTKLSDLLWYFKPSQMLSSFCRKWGRLLTWLVMALQRN